MGDKVTRLNHLLFIDDLKLFAKSHAQSDPLSKTVQIISKDIGMEFGTITSVEQSFTVRKYC